MWKSTVSDTRGERHLQPCKGAEQGNHFDRNLEVCTGGGIKVGLLHKSGLGKFKTYKEAEEAEEGYNIIIRTLKQIEPGDLKSETVKKEFQKIKDMFLNLERDAGHYKTTLKTPENIKGGSVHESNFLVRIPALFFCYDMQMHHVSSNKQ